MKGKIMKRKKVRENRVRIIIPIGADENESTVEVGINGNMSLIKKGAPVEVSMELYLVLKRADISPVLL